MWVLNQTSDSYSEHDKIMLQLLMLLVANAVEVTCPSANAAMTLPKADSDLLIFLASSNTDPSAPVLLT